MYHSSAHCAILNPFLTNVVSRLLWIAQSIPLSTGWQTSEVLRIIFAIAIQLLQPKQTRWFPAGCSHIFFLCISHRNSVCQSSSNELPFWDRIWPGGGSLPQLLFRLWHGPGKSTPWKNKGPPAAAYGTSLSWIPVGYQGSQLYSSPKYVMPHSQTSDDACSDSLLHLGRRMRVTTALVPLHITVGSVPSCLGKLVLPFGEMPAADSAAAWRTEAVWHLAESQLH